MISRLFLSALLLLSGCAAQPQVIGDSQDRAVDFRCATGEDITVRFLAEQDAAILTRSGENIELKQRPAASGFWYTNGPISIRGKGHNLSLEIGRMMPIECQAL